MENMLLKKASMEVFAVVLNNKAAQTVLKL